MATLHMTEAELIKNIASVLVKVREGIEVVIEENHHPVAIIQPQKKVGRPLSECIAAANAYENDLGYKPVPDPDFAKDVNSAITSRNESFNPPAWDECSTPVC